MLADLQNSDFISWKENIMFLDNAWTELYQSLINHGDKTYLQEFSFSGERTYLPDDFYQLYYVCYTNGTYEKPIARKAKTSTGQGPYYDIVGNELIIYRDSVSNMNKIKVQYYPIKRAITYSANEVDLNHDNTMSFSSIYDVAGRYALVNITSSSSSESREIWDMIEGQKVANATNNSTFLYIVSGRPEALVRNGIYFKVNNNGYYSTYSNNKLSIYSILGNNLVREVNVPLAFYNKLSSNVTGTFTNDAVYLYSQYSYLDQPAGVYELRDGIIKAISACTATSIVNFNGNVYYNDNTEGIIKNNEVLYPVGSFSQFNGVMKEDLNTGYGVLVDKYLLKSNFEDTELDFPNNFYYNILAYKLAIYYKIKQNADPSGLMLMLSEAEKTFYNTLPRDENNFIRIANAYAY